MRWLMYPLMLFVSWLVRHAAVRSFPVPFSCVDLNFYNNKHMVLIGDSIMHYQYLSFVYSLRHCHEVSAGQVPAISERNWKNWEEMFIGSNGLLSPFETCDCYRNPLGFDMTTIYTNRYYRDIHWNASVTYINYGWNKDYSTGREQEKTIWSNTTEGVWNYTLPDTIKYRVANLGVKPDILLLNVGLFPNHFHDKSYADEVVNAAHAIPGLQLVWKTTSYRSGDRKAPTLEHRPGHGDVYWVVDSAMCSRANVGCLNVSWTKNLAADAWDKHDHVHFRSYVYNWMNRQMTEYLKWPRNATDVFAHFEPR